MNCLITGGAGHIGSHLALRLHEEGHEVDIIDTKSVVIKDLTDNGWTGEYVEADIKNPQSVAYAFTWLGILYHLIQ